MMQPKFLLMKLGDNSVIEICGCGIVVILAKTSLCHVFSLYLERVLWVPSYGWFTLLSWRTIVPLGKRFSLASFGKEFSIFVENKPDVILR